MLRKVTWFDSPEEAEREVDEYYSRLTPEQRLEEMVQLLNKVGHWNERRLTRTVRFLTPEEIDAKLEAGRAQDLADIEALERIG